MFADLMRKFATLTRATDLPSVRVAGRVWHLAPAGAALLGPRGPDLDRWLADGSAVVVKSNPARVVYRVELPGGTVFVKHCRITGPRAWGREVIRPPKARLEFENAQTLRERGVAAVEPLAWGAPASRWPGESFLVTRALTAVPFVRYLEHDLPTLPPNEQRAVRRQLARAFGEFLAKLHDAGVTHPDPHPGNLLVEIPPSRLPHFALIDLHAVRIGEPLAWPASRDNLVLFNRWFQLRASRADRARFWHAYSFARTTLPPTNPANQVKELEQATLASNLCFWAGRDARCLGTNRYFRAVRGGFAVRDLPEAFLAELLRDPDAAFTRPDARVMKHSRSSTVAELTMPTPAGPMQVVFKRVSAGSHLDCAKNLLRRSAVLRSWANGHALTDRWLPTPRPLAAFHRVRLGLPAEGYLLVEKVPDAVPLDVAVRQCPDRAGLHAILGRLARILRSMHDRGVSHRDLKAANVLLAHGTEPVLIDLVGVRVNTRLSPERRSKELARLNASFLNCPRITPGDRLRFLRTYLDAGKAFQEGWKTWWEMVSRATAIKVEKNHRSGRMLG